MQARCVGVVVNPDKPEAFGLGAELAALADSRGRDVVFERPAPPGALAPEAPLKDVVRQADLILVLGGDGSMLRVAREAAPAGTPMLGIQFGHYGFIMDTEPGRAVEFLSGILENGFRTSDRLMLQMTLQREGASVGEHLALNDVVVARGHTSRMLRLRVAVGEHEVVRYSADGIIVATPTGSTAYSLSAGGPVVHPDVDVIILTPIAPHTLNSRPLVIPASEEIEITAEESPTVTVDGQLFEQMGEGDVVKVRRAGTVARLVRTGRTAFYQQLDSRLGFGDRYDR